MSTTVLLADTEPVTRGLLERHLPLDGFELAAPGGQPDVVLASDQAGLERWRDEAPVIVLGPAEANVGDRVAAFRLGCSDYVPRPFDYEELVERIRAVLRRPGAGSGRRIVAGPVVIDERARTVMVAGRPVALVQKEFALLVRLASDPERVFTKKELLRDVWDYSPSMRTRTLHAHASRLRRKLVAVAGDVDLVENHWGIGYRLLGRSFDA
ncbi:MAG: response regulator transcription factor [Actinomycetes bacterium]